MIKAILLDIEGTTTPIDFVHKVLFPFAAIKAHDFIAPNIDELQNEIEQLQAEHSNDKTVYKEAFDADSPESISNYIQFLINVDRKSTPLKSIQGKIWQAGYESGELVSQVYEDVPKAFERWAAAGKIIAIYSSGSILAQKLIFKYSDHGDLTSMISAYFDTRTGHKRETESYAKIAASLGMQPAEIVFISDITEELDAASSAGFQTVLSARPGNAQVGDVIPHRSVQNFDELNF